ncbi:hypothetical protein [Aestuariivirga sp.]|uniref:hypothetical protein n=1 Tax=Aestuariivirga sp. TaxID=2650926 RepID=UPI003593EB9A
MITLPHEYLAEFLRASLHLNTILNRNEDFLEGKVTIGEWLVMKTILADEECQQKVLSKKLGFSRQRVSKILEGLKKAEFISIKTTALKDGKSINRLSLTNSGNKSVGVVEAKLGSVLSEVSEADLLLLSKASKSVRRINRALSKKGD